MSILFPAPVLRACDARRARVPLLWITAALSLLVHLAALFVYWPDIFPKDKLSEKAGDMRKSMRVMLNPLPDQAPTAPAARAVPAPPVPRAPPRPRAAAPLPRVAQAVPPAPAHPLAAVPATPAVTGNRPAPSAPANTTPSPPAPAEDLAAMIEARRRARAQNAPAGIAAPPPPQPAEDDIARRDRIVAANMSTIRAPTLGDKPNNSGGVFSIQRLGPFDAEFLFYGWNKDVNRRMSQVIEVRIGNHGTIELAVVRRMIAIVREHEREDFSWQSQKAGRVVRLSARAADTAAFEEFLMREFFR